MENIYKTNKPLKIKLLCKKSTGVPSDLNGRYFERGKEYNAKLEIFNVCADTNYKPCTLMWVSFNNGFGSRFSVVGNIHHRGTGYWPNFKKYFYCPMEIERLFKIKKLNEKIYM